MAKIQLSLKDLDVDSFEVMPNRGPGGEGTIRGYQDAWGEAELGGPTYSCDGSCMSCPTNPCDPMCTGPKTCIDTCGQETIATEQA
ncbi:MAG TPA: hypothetical protein VLK84_23390 [Longimicrobium sp.]|nr:hypothetical protein [Longimicrobium sp.]